MRGFNTDSIFTAAYHAQQFANNQLEMAYAAIQERGQREFEKKYAKARTKLEDVHAAYSKERARRQETRRKMCWIRWEAACFVGLGRIKIILNHQMDLPENPNAQARALKI